MTLAAISIPGFNNGVSQQAPVNRRPDQGEIQINGLGTLVDGLMQRPGTEFLSVLTSNAENGVFTHSINRDTTFRYLVFFTGDPTEPIEIFDLTGTKLTVQYGDLDADLNFTANADVKAYALPWIDTELLTNGDFADGTGWTTPTGWTIGGGTASCDGTQVSTSNLYSDISASIGKYYKVIYTISNYSAGTVKSGIGGYDWGTARSADGTYVDIIDGDEIVIGRFYMSADADFIGDIDNISVVELDTVSNPSEVFKAVTVADNTFVINRGITVGKTTDVDAETLDNTVQTFADLPGTPADGDTAKITGDDISGFSSWYVQWDNTNGIWEECIKPGEELGRLKDYTMAHRLVRTSTTTFTFAPCIWEDRTVGDTNTAPDPSFIGNNLQNVFFFKNRLAFLSEDNVIFSETGEYFNFYPKTALDVLDSDPIDGSATSKQVEILRSVAVFDKSLIILADQQQFDLGSGEGALTPTSIAITPTTRFNICPLCEPITAGPNVYFVCPKTDYATIREYYVQPESLLNDAADITAHVPSYIPMGHIQMAACNSLDMLLVHTDADPDAIYLYKYFWSGEDKAQASWSQWTFSGDILGFAIIGTIAYFVIEDADTSEITLEKMELETTTTGSLSFRVHADRQEDVAGTYDSTINRTTFDLSYQVASDEDMMAVIHPTTGRPIVDAAPKEYGDNVITNGTFAADTDWNKGTGWTISGGTANCDGTQPDANQTLNQTSAVVVSTVYRVRYTLSACTAGAVRCQVGTTQGTERTTNGTYEEVITCAGNTTFYFTCDADFIGSIDNVFVEPVATVTDKIEVTGDYSGTTYLIAKKFNFQWRMTPWYLQDANGRPRLQGRLQVRSLVLNYNNTGYFKVEVTPTGRTKMTHEFSGAVIGVSYLGQVTLLSGETRFMILARNTEVDVDIVSDSYFPVAFQSGSWEGVYYPRGRE